MKFKIILFTAFALNVFITFAQKEFKTIGIEIQSTPAAIDFNCRTKAGAEYESIEYKETYNCIPWVNPKINFKPDQSYQYVGDFNGDGFDDIIKIKTGVADERTSDLSDRVNKTIVTYGNSSSIFTHEILYTRIVPIGDINNDGFDDAVGINYNDSWQYYLGSATGLVAHSTVYSSNKPYYISGFVDLNHDGYTDYIQWGNFPNYSIFFGASTIEGITTEDYTTDQSNGSSYNGSMKIYAGKIDNSYDKIMVLYPTLDNIYCIIDSINTSGNKHNVESFSLPVSNAYMTYLSSKFYVVDINGDNFSEIVWSSYSSTYALTKSDGSRYYALSPIQISNKESIPVGDINNDGRCDFYLKDLLSLNIALSPLSISTGLTGTWTLNGSNYTFPTATYNYNLSLKYGNINGDSYIDMLCNYDNELYFGNRIYYGNNTNDIDYDNISYPKADYINKEPKRSVNIGDINNDGTDDFALYDNSNIQIFLNELDVDKVNFEIELSENDESIYFKKVIGGNFNNDEYSDIAVLKRNGQGEISDMVFYFGGENFNIIPDHTIDLSVAFNETYSQDCGIQNIGDINNDGMDDMLVFIHREGDSGKIGIFYGQSSISQTPDILLDYKDSYYGGRALPLKDINNDGVDDFAIAAFYSLNEKIHVYFGQQASTTENVTYTPDITLRPDTTNNTNYHSFGLGFTSGDFNGDNIMDIAAVAYQTRNGSEYINPLVHFYYGGDELDSIPDLKLEIPVVQLSGGANFPNAYRFRMLPDLNNDGIDEIYCVAGDSRNGLIIYGGDYLVPDSIPAKMVIAPNQSVSFETPLIYYFASLDPAVGDFDGNGSIELIIQQEGDANYQSAPVYLFELSKADDVTNIIIDNNNIDNDILIYPNPADDYLYINFEYFGNTDLNIQIFNLTGELMVNRKFQNHDAIQEINISDIKPGLYILKIESNGIIKTNKILIQ